MVFNATFNNISVISWQSVLLLEEIGVPGEKKHRPVASNWQTLLHNVVSSTSRHERGSNSQLVVIPTTIRSRPGQPPVKRAIQTRSDLFLERYSRLHLVVLL